MKNTKAVYSTNKNKLREIQVKTHCNIKSKIQDNKQAKKKKSCRGYYSYFI